MEEASEDDLALATTQGTIVEIDVDGVSYGGAITYTYYDESAGVSYSAVGGAALVALLAGSGVLVARRRRSTTRRRSKSKKKRRSKRSKSKSAKKKKKKHSHSRRVVPEGDAPLDDDLLG